MIVPVGAVTWANPLAAPRKPLAPKGIVAARIQEHEVQTTPCRRHLVEHEVRIDKLVFDVTRAGDAGFDGNQVILPPDLHTVAGKIEKGDAVCREPTPELANQCLELRSGHVDLRPSTDDRKSGVLKCFCDESSIIARVGECG
jgi:hypothetical protein